MLAWEEDVERPSAARPNDVDMPRPAATIKRRTMPPIPGHRRCRGSGKDSTLIGSPKPVAAGEERRTQ